MCRLLKSSIGVHAIVFNPKKLPTRLCHSYSPTRKRSCSSARIDSTSGDTSIPFSSQVRSSYVTHTQHPRCVNDQLPCVSSVRRAFSHLQTCSSPCKRRSAEVEVETDGVDAGPSSRKSIKVRHRRQTVTGRMNGKILTASAYKSQKFSF